MRSPRSVTLTPTGMPCRSLNAATDRRARLIRGFWPVMAAMSAIWETTAPGVYRRVPGVLSQRGDIIAEEVEVGEFEQGLEIGGAVLRADGKNVAERVLGEDRCLERRLRQYNSQGLEVGLGGRCAVDFEAGGAILPLTIVAGENASDLVRAAIGRCDAGRDIHLRNDIAALAEGKNVAERVLGEDRCLERRL